MDADENVPAIFVSMLMFGCESPAQVQQRVLPIARAKLKEFMDYSILGGYCPFPVDTHVQSSTFVRQVVDMMMVVAPPVLADLRLETQLVHIAIPNTENGFSLCFPVSKMSVDQRKYLDIMLKNPDKYFFNVRRPRTDVTLQFGEKPPPRCSRCKFNDKVTEVLAHADFLLLATTALRQMIRCKGDAWCVYQCILDQVAQDNELNQKKPSFAEFYYSVIRSWEELRAKPNNGENISPIHLSWRALTRVRAAHFVTRGQRTLAADLFFMREGENGGDRGIVDGFEILRSLVLCRNGMLPAETMHMLRLKPVFMAAAAYCRNAGRNTLALLYKMADMNKQSVVTRALLPYAWPPAFKTAPEKTASKVKKSDRPQWYQRAVRTVKSILFINTELHAEFFAFDLGLAQWYSAWLAVCRAKQLLPAAREARRRPLGAALLHITSLHKEPKDAATAEELQAVAEAVVSSVINERALREQKKDAEYIPYDAGFWPGGTIDVLSEHAALRSHYFEMNAIVCAFENNMRDNIVLQLHNVPRGIILSAQYTAETLENIEAVALEDAVLMIGSRAALEKYTVEMVVQKQWKFKHYTHMIDVLAWAFCANEPLIAAHVVGARYKMQVHLAQNTKKFGMLMTLIGEFFEKNAQNVNDRAVLGGLVRELIGYQNQAPDKKINTWKELVHYSESVFEEAVDLPMFTRRATVATKLEFSSCAITDNARALAEFVLQLPHNATTATVNIWNELPIFLKTHPLQHLCDGTVRNVDHPLWSPRPDLLRIILHAISL